MNDTLLRVQEQNRSVKNVSFLTVEEKKHEAPIPLSEFVDDLPKFPVECLDDELLLFISALHDRVQSPIDICAQSVLAAISLSVQAHCNIVMDDMVLPCSNFFITIAESGERKSAIDKIVLTPIRHYENELVSKYNFLYREYKLAEKRYHQNFKQDDAALEPIKPLEAMIIAEEPTYEGLVKSFENGQPSMGLFSDEGGRFFHGHAMNQENKGKTLAGLTGLWDARPINRVRSDSKILLRGRRLTIHLMIQPKMIESFLKDGIAQDQGFFSRCLISSPKSLIGTRKYQKGNIFQNEFYQIYHEKILKLMKKPTIILADERNALDPRKLKCCQEAEKVFVAFGDYVESESNSEKRGKYSAMKGFASKSMEHSMRLAAILTLYADSEAQYVSKEKAEMGVKIVTYYLSQALRMLNITVDSAQMLSYGEKIKLAELLLDWIKERLAKTGKNIITLREMMLFSPRKIRNKELLLYLITILIDHEWLEITQVQNSFILRNYSA